MSKAEAMEMWMGIATAFHDKSRRVRFQAKREECSEYSWRALFLWAESKFR